jgi:hypothetical protein
MNGGLQSQRYARQHRTGDGFDHRDQVVARQRTLRDSPQVQLMRLADVQTIDCVAPVGQTRASEQHVGIERRRDHAQSARNHCRGLRPQEQLWGQITRVTRVAGCTVGRIAEVVVIVGGRNHRWRAIHHDRTVPRCPQGIERVLHEKLHRVRPERCVSQVAQRQQTAVGV